MASHDSYSQDSIKASVKRAGEIIAKVGEEDDTADSPLSALRDLLTELRHWCAEHGHDYDTIDARAAEVYEEEVLFAKEEAEEEKARVARPRRKRRKKRRPASPVRERAVGRVRERPRLA